MNKISIYIDAREAYSEHKTGKGQWSRAFIEELATRNVDLTLCVTKSTISPKGNFTVQTFSDGLRFHLELAKYCRQTQPQAFISPTSFIVPILLGKQYANMCNIIIHDMIAFQSGKHDFKAKYIERLLVPRLLKFLPKLFTVSTATKDEILHLFPKVTAKIVPIFAGTMQATSLNARVPENFLLCAGTLCPRKNQFRLLRAYNQLPQSLQKKHPLLLVGGRGWSDQNIVDLASESKYVTWKGYVTDQEYLHLLHTCFALVYPSEYEGFGLQVLDALACGVPVLTSQGGSLQEVVGEAGIIVDPFSEQSILSGLEQLLTSKSLRDSLSQKGPIQAKSFTWKRTVDTLLSHL